MLQSLYIKNFVLIEQLELDFHRQLNVFTGETGAGKSILIGALSLLLGGRADAKVIGSFAEQCEIIGSFEIIGNPQVQQWLTDNDLADGDELMVRRTLSTNGRSKIRLNGRPTTVTQIRQLAPSLLKIHGQHEQIKLLDNRQQKAILDNSGDHQNQLQATAQAYRKFKEYQQQQQQLIQAGSLSEEQLQLLEYQLTELEQLNLQAQEYQNLYQQLDTVANAQSLIDNIEQVLQRLQDSDWNAQTQLSQSIQQLQQSQGKDFTTIAQMLDEAMINITEACNELTAEQKTIDNDPEQQQQIEQRLATISQTARKHKVSPETLFDHHQQLLAQKERHQQQQQSDQKLKQQLQNALADYQKQAQKLHQARCHTATKLAQNISKVIQQLGLKQAKLNIEVTPQVEQQPQIDGNDRVEIMIAANQGQAFQALNKTASGGELSRISLAIELCCQAETNCQSFVFDEVDSGIGGATAEKVGKIMQTLATNRQVFAVTHLPQVAGHADQHYKIDKQTHNGHTTTTVTELNQQQQIEELARMTGGQTITPATIAQATEFLKPRQPKTVVKPTPSH